MQTSRTKFGEQTPPAIFPNMMGLFGLGLAWRQAERAFALPQAFSQVVLGAVTLLFLFGFVAYLRKVSRRPGVLVDDLRVLPGRAGIAAMTLSLYLLAASLVPVNAEIAKLVLLMGLLIHLIVVVLVLRVLFTGPAEQRQVTPVWHLVFVGFIIAPLSAIPLGYQTASTNILFTTGAVAVAIWGISLWQLISRIPPAPLRPLLAIHLAPACLLGTVAAMSAQMTVAYVAVAMAVLILLALLTGARFLTQAGFSPLWGAFTFPIAAFANLMFAMDSAAGGTTFALIGILALVAASAIIPVIAVKVFQAWAKGQLAVKTNAARA
ncbi:C4-dicarboxylate transporter/malic acid transport protein family [Actibacterium atlanticum]|uniref:C4-dicarboxylate transporter/malic acid transport protein family n=1 Tax=Actibacterium atlanticum TaxID=1461693 RepID=A0A058ZRL7_9RHOB|nr:tellurium resistance protein [Actibacterium atlanticum]KCV83792.1 C4-dicarboxylate transporter/malic acid transport protein family [Actibacterium atlanticum]